MSSFTAFTSITRTPNSQQAARELAQDLIAGGNGETLKAVIINDTGQHNHNEFLQTFRQTIGPDPKIIGSTTQGIVSRGVIEEKGMLGIALGLYGEGIKACTAIVNEIGQDSFQKGQELGQKIIDQATASPKVAIILFDPMSGVDVDQLAQGLYESIPCPIVGGSAGSIFSRLVQSVQPLPALLQTFQYHDAIVTTNSAVVLTLSGTLEAFIDYSHACESTGIPLNITRAEGNLIYEFDGSPALDAWMNLTSTDLNKDPLNLIYWMLGLTKDITDNSPSSNEEKAKFVRGIIGIDKDKGAMKLLSPLPDGTEIELHQQSKETAETGIAEMSARLNQRLQGHKPIVALGFECGARTGFLLGTEGSQQEILTLQSNFNKDIPWWGILAWGEIAPAGKIPRYHNYTFPLLILTDGK